LNSSLSPQPFCLPTGCLTKRLQRTRPPRGPIHLWYHLASTHAVPATRSSGRAAEPRAVRQRFRTPPTTRFTVFVDPSSRGSSPLVPDGDSTEAENANSTLALNGAAPIGSIAARDLGFSQQSRAAAVRGCYGGRQARSLIENRYRSSIPGSYGTPSSGFRACPRSRLLAATPRRSAAR
jgi:hypothetical protein